MEPVITEPRTALTALTAKPRVWILLALLLCAAAAVRYGYLQELEQQPDFTAPGRDALYHDYWARAQLSDDWIPPVGKADPKIESTPYMRAPGYPWFLAGVYRALGPSYSAPRWAQGALGLVVVFLLFALGRRLGSDRVGLLAAAMGAFSWVLIYYEGELHEPIVAIFLLLLAVWVAVRRRPPISAPSSAPRLAAASEPKEASAPSVDPNSTPTPNSNSNSNLGLDLGLDLLLGLLLGVLIWVRPNAVLLVPVFAAWRFWVSGGRASRRALSAGLILVAAVVMVLPLTLRNHKVSGDWVPISSTAGLNLYLAHHPDADGTSARLPFLREAGVEGWDCFDYPRIVAAIGAVEGQSLSDAEASAALRRRALDFVRGHPIETLRSALRRAALFWGPAEVSNDEIVAWDRRQSRWLSRLPTPFWLWTSLGLLGAGLLVLEARKRTSISASGGRGSSKSSKNSKGSKKSKESLKSENREELEDSTTIEGSFDLRAFVLLGLVIGVYFVSVWPTLAAARYRVPVVPLLMLFGAVGVNHLLAQLLRRDRKALRGLIGTLAATLVLAFLASRPWVKYEPDEGAWFFNRGVAHQRLGNLDAAIADYETALRIDPRDHDAVVNWAVALGQKGGASESDKARDALRTLVEARPNSAAAWSQLGASQAAAGDPAAAVGAYEKALELRPDLVEAWNNLGFTLTGMGQLADAERALRRALELRPEYPRAVANLAALRSVQGTALATQGRLEDAEKALREALALDPSRFEALVDLGVLLLQTGRADAARVQLDRAGDLEPNAAAAALRLAWVRTYGPAGIRDPSAAVRAAEQGLGLLGASDESPQALLTLAAAYAASGRETAAVAAAKRGLALAQRRGDTTMTKEIEVFLANLSTNASATPEGKFE